MLAFFFAQSKHYVDNLSELTLRGMRSKASKGIYPSRAKIGYMNHPRTKEIIPDPTTFPLIKKAHELYATNRYGLRDMTKLLLDLGLRAPRTGGTLCKHQVVDILSDTFYHVVFTWTGETYEGIHQPAVSKALWDKLALVRQGRSRAQAKWTKEFQFLGLIRCAECGSSITAETHFKRYKNGTSQSFYYYRCTKKSGTVKCEQPFIREENLSAQMAENIRVLALPENEEWIEPMMRQLDAWEIEEGSRESAQVSELNLEVEKIAAKLRRLTDLHLDGEIERPDYTSRRRVLINEKIALETRMKLISQEGPFAWLEPLRKLLNAVRERNLPTAGGDLNELRDFIAEVGSNLTLNSRKVLWDWNPPYALLAERGSYGNWQPQRELNPCLHLERVTS
jgi:site-specific DNA recombinase